MKKKKPRVGLFGWVIIILMVSSVFGVMFYGFANPTSKFEYNGHKFRLKDRTFVTTIKDNDLTFYTMPQDLDLEMPPGTLKKLNDGMVYFIMFNPEDKNLQIIDLIRFELADLALRGVFQKFFVPGITKESDLYNLPVISCSNASASTPVLHIVTGNSTQVTEYNNCITFEASYGFDMLRIRDTILYSTLGILEDGEKTTE